MIHMRYYVDYYADWLNEIAPSEFEDNDLFRIVTFFVFHSPCEKTSARGVSLQEYHWSKPWGKPYYLNRQLKNASTNPNLLFSAKSSSNMDASLGKANLLENFPCNLEQERICIHDNKKNQFISVFFHLRNAFAHCRLNMVNADGECIFIIEDVGRETKGRYPVSARMILRKSTLLKWIDIIEGGERECNSTRQK